MTGVADTAQAIAAVERTPGGVELVQNRVFRNAPVQTIKDILQYVPGVIVQPHMGDAVRLSIRGSGLSRAYRARKITPTTDGIPVNPPDGLLDFFEGDPTAYRMWRCSRAPMYGSNMLRGAPVGRDASRSSAC